MIKEKKK